MIIKKITYKPFDLKLKSPFITAKQIISERKGYIIQIEDELGNVAFGEISPLPNFSFETLKEAERDTRKLMKSLKEKQFLESLFEIEKFLSVYSFVPSVRLGCEQALMNLLIKRNLNLIHNELKRIPKTDVLVNAVIGICSDEDFMRHAKAFFDMGYRTFKVKVGREKFEDDLKIIYSFRSNFGDHVNLRLDANGRWDADNAFDHLQKLEHFNIEYIEDPCSHLNCILKLSNASPVPIAVDESINSTEQVEYIINHSNIKFVVVKPMIMGSIIKIIKLIEFAERHNVNIIISSAFECAVGNSALVFLASLTNHNYAHGLATSNYFESEFEKEFYPIQNGKITFDINKYPPSYHS